MYHKLLKSHLYVEKETRLCLLRLKYHETRHKILIVSVSSDGLLRATLVVRVQQSV